MTVEIRIPKKLIEVALPLDSINTASAKEKSIRHGHPSTIHLWWARRPLAAARAVVFAQMVNDPGYERHLNRGVNKEKAQKERERLFGIIERLVQWDNTSNEDLLREAREEIWKSWRETCALNKEHPNAASLFNPEILPAFHDPFAGGGALPLEAQRLGLESYASDLNPVAVAINKALIEIPSRFAGAKPVGPIQIGEKEQSLISMWPGGRGLAEDVRRYGAWMREEAIKRIGHLYPTAEITSELTRLRPDLKPLVGKKLPVIAWIWARTVRSPNPAFSHVDVPLVSTFVLSSKAGKEAYIEPVLIGDQYSFVVRLGIAPQHLEKGTKLSRGANFKCIISGSPLEPEYVYSQANGKRMGTRLMAMVVEGPKGRLYLPPTNDAEVTAKQCVPTWQPELEMPGNARWFSPPLYGLKKYADIFTSRQLVALNTFSELVLEASIKCSEDAKIAGLADDGVALENGGKGAKAYAEAIAVYLAFALSKAADRNSALCFWEHPMDRLRGTFGRQALPMVWDFAETNPLAGAGGDIFGTAKSLAEVLDNLMHGGVGTATQASATTQRISANKVVSTDPPYYDNIGYADLSEFFYIWLKRSLAPIFSNLFDESSTPKAEELVATPYRHGNKENAEKFFMLGMSAAMAQLHELAHPAFPVTIYYAFRQSETKNDATSSTGWETFLEALLRAGFMVVGTWPLRTELTVALKKQVNALASSILLVCRRRPTQALTISRREFIRELGQTLPEALEEMTKGAGGEHSPVAPVDLSQAVIGPGMGIFSKYSAVLEADGSLMSVKTALQLINRFFAEDDFDHDTQFCLSWFEGHGWEKGKFGEADVLARAKGTSVDGLRVGGVVESGAGTLRLLRSIELTKSWNPESDSRLSVWELLHQMIRSFNSNGESGAGEILSKTARFAESVRTLAYRIYTLCERKGWAQDAGQYNSFVLAWDAIEAAARSTGYSGTQVSLFGDEQAQQSTSKLPKKTTRKKK
jgi:putative DNA methylase